MIVSNTSPLIYISKISKLTFLKEKFDRVIISEKVYEEITKGREFSVEVEKIEKAMKEGWIEKIKARNKRKSNELKVAFPNLGEGEIESILISEEKNLPLLLDDSAARRIGESLRINVHGTLFVILKAFENKLISKEEAIKLIDKLVEEGFRISVELYSQLINELKNLQKKLISSSK